VFCVLYLLKNLLLRCFDTSLVLNGGICEAKVESLLTNESWSLTKSGIRLVRLVLKLLKLEFY
jgi:hypothetical protein